MSTRARSSGLTGAVVATALGLALAACGDDGPQPYRDGACYVEQRYDISTRAAAHACVHIDEGPFDDRVAAPERDDAEALTQSHTNYSVELAGGSDERAGGGYLRFTSEVATAYSFYFDGLSPVELVAADGQRLCPATRLGLDECGGLGLVEVHELNIGQTVFIRFGQSDEASATVILERY